MPRLFAGIEIPIVQRQQLALLSGPLPGAKWVAAEDMHVTLRFAGDLDNHVADDFAEFLAGIEVPPFEMRITELGVFGGREPRLIYAAAEGGAVMEGLQRATERAARAAGLGPEARNYKPHVSLARLRGTPPEAVARFLGSRGKLVLAPFKVERFVLYSSKPKVGGGPYVIEEAYPLG